MDWSWISYTPVFIVRQAPIFFYIGPSMPPDIITQRIQHLMATHIELNSVAFSVSVVGETTGQTLLGNFRAKKRLSHADRLRRDQIRRELLGGVSPDSANVEAVSLATGISDLRVRLVEVPSWWESSNGGMDLEDESVLVAVYTQAVQIEADAKEEIAKKAAAAQSELKAP